MSQTKQSINDQRIIAGQSIFAAKSVNKTRSIKIIDTTPMSDVLASKSSSVLPCLISRSNVNREDLIKISDHLGLGKPILIGLNDAFFMTDSIWNMFRPMLLSNSKFLSMTKKEFMDKGLSIVRSDMFKNFDRIVEDQVIRGFSDTDKSITRHNYLKLDAFAAAKRVNYDKTISDVLNAGGTQIITAITNHENVIDDLFSSFCNKIIDEVSAEMKSTASSGSAALHVHIINDGGIPALPREGSPSLSFYGLDTIREQIPYGSDIVDSMIIEYKDQYLGQCDPYVTSVKMKSDTHSVSMNGGSIENLRYSKALPGSATVDAKIHVSIVEWNINEVLAANLLAPALVAGNEGYVALPQLKVIAENNLKNEGVEHLYNVVIDARTLQHDFQRLILRYVVAKGYSVMDAPKGHTSSGESVPPSKNFSLFAKDGVAVDSDLFEAWLVDRCYKGGRNLGTLEILRGKLMSTYAGIATQTMVRLGNNLKAFNSTSSDQVVKNMMTKLVSENKTPSSGPAILFLIGNETYGSPATQLASDHVSYVKYYAGRVFMAMLNYNYAKVDPLTLSMLYNASNDMGATSIGVTTVHKYVDVSNSPVFQEVINIFTKLISGKNSIDSIFYNYLYLPNI